MLEMKTDLVRSARNGPGFNAGERFPSFDNFELRLGIFASRVAAMVSMFFGLGSKARLTDPLIVFRISANDGEIAFVHAARFKQIAVGAHRARAFPEQ